MSLIVLHNSGAGSDSAPSSLGGPQCAGAFAALAAILALCGGCSSGNVNVLGNPGSGGSGSGGSGGPTSAPAVSVDRSTLAFSSQVIGTSATAQIVRVSNTGNAPLAISGISVSGTDAAMFSETNTCGSGVSAGQSCMVSVTFTPSSTGGKSASLDVLTDAATNPVITLSGTGAPPPAPIASADRSSLAFGAQIIATSSTPQVITLSNTGNATLAVNGVSIGGTDAAMFSQTNTCGSGVAAGQSCTVSVTFMPASTGDKSASLDLLTDAATSPVIALTGTGTPPPAPIVSLDHSSLAFGPQIVGTSSAAQTVTVSNTGNAALTVSAISVVGTDAAMFAQTNTCGASVPAGQSCTVSVTFTPTNTGVRSASVNLLTNAATSPVIDLSGTGLPQIGFTDVTDQAGVTHSSETYGASWGDVSGDGFPDLFVSNHRTAKSLFVNTGNGTFVDIAPTINNFANRPNADTHGASWADFDNNGTQDLLVSIGTGNPSEWYVNTNGKLNFATVGSGFDVTSLGGRMPVWLDYDNDHRLDMLLAQYAGSARLFHQNPDGTFTDTTSTAKLLCLRFHYVQLIDVNNDGRLDVMCSGETLFPQKIYDTSKLPWKTLYNGTLPAPFLPVVHDVVDSAVADFNNDGRMDMFILSGVQNRPSSVVQKGNNQIEAMLAGGAKGFFFVSPGTVTYTINWNKAADGGATDVRNIQIGANATHPATTTFTLDPANSAVWGMPPAPTDPKTLPLMQIGYDTTAHRWTLQIVTKLQPTDKSIFSEGYMQVTTSAPITGLKATGLWATDKPARPTLLINRNGTFVDETVAWKLDTPVQCASVTAGDFDNDMYVDLYLACRTGASNIANILYHNNGNGTFTAVTDAGGAAGPIGLAIADGAGTADSVVTADYDEDGFLDLFVTNGFNIMPLYVGGPDKLFHNDGNANHWIELDLIGVNSDRDATGARVYATATGSGVTQFRVQDGRYHRWSQDSKRIHFGLASATTVSLTIKWPSGLVQTFPSVAADKIYSVTEGQQPK